MAGLAVSRWNVAAKLTWTAIDAIGVAAGSGLALMARLLLFFQWQQFTSAYHAQLSAATRHDAFHNPATDASWPTRDPPRLNRGLKVRARVLIRSVLLARPRRYRGSCLHSASHEHAISFLCHMNGSLVRHRIHSAKGNAYPMAPSLLLDFRQ